MSCSCGVTDLKTTSVFVVDFFFSFFCTFFGGGGKGLNFDRRVLHERTRFYSILDVSNVMGFVRPIVCV